ncbi:MAG: response regulator [Alphaproteobacteria bacterium]|nr:response regulator [Alphaproteobacteria bacterium]
MTGRARLVRVGMGAVLASCLVFAVARAGVQLSSGALTPWWANALGFAVMAALWFWFHQDPDGRADVSIHASAVVATGALVVPVAYGMPSTLWWLALVPMAMVLLATLRAGGVWTVATVAVVAVGSWVSEHAVVVGAAGEAGVEVFLARVVFVGILVGIALGFRREVDRRSAELRAVVADLEEASQAKDRFLAHMSHELRTPLHAVVAMTELALEADLPPDVRNRVHTAHASAGLLHRLLNDLLDVSRAQEARLELAERDFSLAAVLADTLGPLAHQARERGLDLVGRSVGEVPDARTGDPVRLAQIVLNLVGNALKHTAEGRVEVTVAADGDRVVLTVDDTGPGIPEADRERVFEPFTQLAPDTDGAGLGLAIVAELTGRMGGGVTALEAPSGGARLVAVVRFGVRPGPSLPADLLAVREEPVHAVPVAPRLRVLVAEDDATSRLVARAFLVRLGHEATLVEDGIAALEALDVGEYDVVITDLRMPRLDGLGLLDAMRDRGHAVPVVLCSAQTGAALPEAPADAVVLGKPFTLEELAHALDSASGGGPG